MLQFAPMRSISLRASILTLSVLMLAACGDAAEVTSIPTAEVTSTPTPEVGPLSMGGGALGGNAETTTLAQQVLDGTLSGDPSWVSHEVRLAVGESLEHSHEFAFVYAKEGVHLLRIGSVSQEIDPGEGAVIPSDETHRHDGLSGQSVFWEIRLAPRGSAYPTDAANTRLIFESDPLEGIPNNSLAAFVHVLVPQGGRTSVHTHPGPEFIYQLSGQIEYQNAIIGSIEMEPGAIEGIPPRTPVHVRRQNKWDKRGAFKACNLDANRLRQFSDLPTSVRLDSFASPPVSSPVWRLGVRGTYPPA